MNSVNQNTSFCGLDFGTSNSSIGYCSGDMPTLSQFDGKGYMPSGIFFDPDLPKPLFGNQAIERYVDCGEGRMIWSPKNALGSRLILEKTSVGNKAVSFKDIIGLIVKNLKEHCEAQSKSEITSVLCGRPVFFSDDDPELDLIAQNALEEILRGAGFKHVKFEYEPIAAALHYERSITRPQIAFIVDMGGGTSDFTIAKLKPANQSPKDRKNDILSVGGIHIAGTDFDKQLSLKTLMPELGLGAKYLSTEQTWREVPPTIHNDLATWHKIGFSYTNQNIAYAKSKIYSSNCPEKFERLLHTLQFRYGHYLARLVERLKISLSDEQESSLKTSEIKPPIALNVSRSQFEDAIKNQVQRIGDTVKRTLTDAGVSPDRIDAIFMTGGSSLIPAVRQNIVSLMKNAQLIEGDKFGSVAMGLTIAAKNQFR